MNARARRACAARARARARRSAGSDQVPVCRHVTQVIHCIAVQRVSQRAMTFSARAAQLALSSILLVVWPPCCAPAATSSWTRTAGPVTVSVDTTSFGYTAFLGGGSGCSGFANGSVGFRCGGVHYTQGTTLPGGANLVLSGAPREGSGVDSLGTFDSITADWQGGSSAACAVHTEIRYYPTTASFVFVADFSEDGVAGTNATALLSDQPVKNGGPSGDPGLSTAFPIWPTGTMGTECVYYSYEGNSLGNNWRAGALSTWSGGLQAGPLLLYAANSTELHPPAMLISPLTHAKAMIGSPGDKDAPSVGFGVQGYVEELTPSFTSAVILVGRTGIAATQMAWGEAVRRNAGTDRLTLDKDILNSKVTYWTDNGACAQNCCPSTVVFFFFFISGQSCRISASRFQCACECHAVLCRLLLLQHLSTNAGQTCPDAHNDKEPEGLPQVNRPPYRYVPPRFRVLALSSFRWPL